MRPRQSRHHPSVARVSDRGLANPNTAMPGPPNKVKGGESQTRLGLGAPPRRAWIWALYPEREPSDHRLEHRAAGQPLPGVLRAPSKFVQRGESHLASMAASCSPTLLAASARLVVALSVVPALARTCESMNPIRKPKQKGQF